MTDLSALPVHIGIIMDGNGRWARNRNLPRTAGHKEGLTAAKRTVRAAAELGVQFVTLYTFSTENWKRAEEEVSFLMRLIQQHLRNEYAFYKENNIKVVHSGEISALPNYVQKEIANVMEDTCEFQGLTLNLAINYGGRDEICRAFNRWTQCGTAASPRGVTPADIKRHLDQAHMPDTDLIIRTGGEQRISNFLLWQCAYAELYFSDILWPDFGRQDLLAALNSFQERERRFGNAK